jgi:hypothetical protein
MASDLGLAGDLDDVELIQAVEAAFGVRLSNDELTRLQTVGDLRDLLQAHVRHVERGDLPCVTAAAYRRLRSAIRKRRPELLLHPKTPMRSFIGRSDARDWWQYLEGEAALALPQLTLSIPGALVVVALVVSPVAVFYFAGSSFGILSLPLLPAAGWLSRRLGRNLPREPETLGALARVAAAKNISSLSWPAGVVRTKDIWSSLEAIIRDELSFPGPIRPETRFFPKR